MDYPKSTPNVGLVGGKFVDENVGTGTPGSLIPATWGNAVTDELLAVIKAAGIVPAEGDLSQLLKAIQAIAASDIKRSVRVATTGPIALSGLQTIDAESLKAGDRVLVKDQATASQNWIYTVAAGAWVRAQDANESAECTPGHMVIVEAGAAHGGSLWQLSNTTLPTLGTTALTFARVFGKTGVGAGTYRSVTVDAQGRVTAGSNPTTVAGYSITDVHTKTEVATLLASKANNATTLGGYGIGDAYTKSQVDNLLSGKASNATTLGGYGIGDAYTKSQVDNLLTGKANNATTLGGYGITDAATKLELAEKITALQATEIARNVGFRAATAVQPAATDFNFDDMTERGCSDLLVWGAHPNGNGVAAYFYLEVFNYGASGAAGQVQQRLTPYKIEANSTTYMRTRYQGNWSVWIPYVTESTLLGLLPTATAARAGILKLNHSTYSTDQTSAASAYAVGMLAAAKAGADNVLPPDAIGGLVISSSVDAVVAVTAGRARDAADSIDIALGAAMTKRLQSSGAWAAGSGANGLFSGVKTSATWYHVFAIKKDSDGAVDVGFDTSVTAANRPAGYSAYRRVGSFRTDATGKIIPFVVDQFTNGARRFRWTTPVMDVADATLSTSAVAYALSVPPGVQVIAELNTFAYQNNTIVYFSSLDTADLAPANSAGYTGFTCGYGAVTDSGSESAGLQLYIKTNTAGQVRARANLSSKVCILTLGWEE